MDEQTLRRLAGLERLIHDGVASGTDLVERHHRHAAAKPFNLLESVKPIAGPARIVRHVHDGVLTLSYGCIRATNRLTRIAGAWFWQRLNETEARRHEEPGRLTTP